MNVAHPSSRQLLPWQVLTRGLAGLFIAFLLVWFARPAHAAPPPAGTSISNMASATYSDASGVARTVSSNLVQTTVTQVYSLTLGTNGAQSATPGSVVYYPHTLTNTGNGSDSFTLSASSAATQFQATSVQIFLDNGSGQPTGSAITGNVSVASGATYKFIVQATVPTNATTGQTNDITVTAKSVGDTSKTGSNTDTTTVTSNAVIKLSKTVSVASGKPGDGPFTYTLNYTNTGNSDATSVVITDPLPAGLTLVANSTAWSLTSTTGIGDTATITGTNGATLTMASDTTTNTFKATISKVSPGTSGWVTFSFKVGASTAPGTLTNTASTTYSTGGTSGSATSNGVGFAVLQSAAVSITSNTIATAAAGATVTFKNTVTNNGNGTDTFNITVANASFPTGTTFALYKSDGATPLVDTGTDSTPDTGPLAPGATYDVYVKATLPPNASSASAVTANVTATSVFDSANAKATGVDTLSAITSAKVDLLAVDSSATTVGGGAGPEGTAVVTNATNPNTSTTFTLVVKNTGTQPDTYNLAASTDSAFATVAVPTGWTVAFKSDGGSGTTCSTTAGTISSTGTVAVNGSATVCAVVSVPAGYTAGDVQLYFRALSPSSTASDRLHALVTVNAVRSLTLTPVGNGQTYSGGSYVYVHTLTNTGNVDEAGSKSTLTPALTNNVSGWTSTLYYDSNGNGVLDATDTLITGDINAVITSLPKGASITLFNKVIAPGGANAGAVNTTTITVTTTNGATTTTTAPAPTVTTDNTTVIAGNLQLTKLQALDSACTGTVAAASYSQAALNAKPGECVMYQITVSNVGAADATNVIVSDSTPSYTTLSTAATTTSGQLSTLAVGSAGTINAYIGTGANSAATPPVGGTLAAGQSATITFGVKITP